MNATLHEVQSTVAEEMKLSFSHLDEEQIQHMVMFGLTEEAGEVVGLMKRRIRAYEKDRKKSTFLHFAEELGDVLWYLAACCQVENITLDDIWKVNREKLEARYGNTARVGGHATSNPPLVITQCDNVGGKSE